jgi:hypothetical protein
MMGFKKVNTQATDIKQHKDEPFEGFYMGSKDIETKIGPQVVYKFQRRNKLPFNVYGFTNLNRAMEMVEEGQYCRLTYTGTENVQTKFGMKDVHQVMVETDEDIVFERDTNSDMPEENTEQGPF